MPLIRPPHADPSLDPFDDGIGTLSRDGETSGHVLTCRLWFWSPVSPLRRQWYIWYTIVWADGSHEPESEEYPPFIAVEEMKSGFLDVRSVDPDRCGRYDFQWLGSEGALASNGDLDSAGNRGRLFDSLVEAISWWRIDPRDGRRRLADAATDALLSGAEGLAVAQLAGLRADENPFAVDRLIERVIDDLDLHAAMEEDDELIASRFLCRELLRGAISERELARWAYQQFHHDSTSDDLNRLAEIDDEFDLAGTVIKRSTRSLEFEVRLIALKIVRG